MSEKKNKDITGDPWNGRTLEWSTSSPPPFYNFAFIPEVHERDAFWVMKQKKHPPVLPKEYEDIHMPRNSGMGFYIASCSFVIGFALTWHMFWLAALGSAGIIICMVLRLADEDTEYYVKASEVKKIESANLRALS